MHVGGCQSFLLMLILYWSNNHEVCQCNFEAISYELVHPLWFIKSWTKETLYDFCSSIVSYLSMLKKQLSTFTTFAAWMSLFDIFWNITFIIMCNPLFVGKVSEKLNVNFTYKMIIGEMCISLVGNGLSRHLEYLRTHLRT